MVKLSLGSQEYVHYEGSGKLRDQFGNVINAHFYCSVLYDGSIIGELFFPSSNDLHKIDIIIDSARA